MKQLLALLLCLACLLCCGCGTVTSQDDNNTRPSGPADTETTLGPAVETTPEPSSEPTVAETEPPAPVDPVVTAAEYTREIIKTPESTTYLTHHSIRYPALSSTSADAQAINAEISYNCTTSIATLENYEEGEYIYLTDYFYTEYNGLIGLVIHYDIGLHYGGLYGVVEEYFFDSTTGKRLTFEEYAAALGLTPEQVCQAMDDSGEMGFLFSYTLEWFVADEYRTYVYVKSPDAFDDYAAWNTQTSLLTP